MHAGGRIVTAMMSEVTSQLQAKFCKHAEPAKQKKIAVCNCSFYESGNQQN